MLNVDVFLVRNLRKKNRACTLSQSCANVILIVYIIRLLYSKYRYITLKNFITIKSSRKITSGIPTQYS